MARRPASLFRGLPFEPSPVASQAAGEALYVPDRTWSLHYEQGYDEGRRMAVEQLLRSLLSITEEFIRAEPGGGGDDLRRIVYRFEEHLERRIWSLSRDEGVVEGGLGI